MSKPTPLQETIVVSIFATALATSLAAMFIDPGWPSALCFVAVLFVCCVCLELRFVRKKK